MVYVFQWLGVMIMSLDLSSVFVAFWLVFGVRVFSPASRGYGYLRSFFLIFSDIATRLRALVGGLDLLYIVGSDISSGYIEPLAMSTFVGFLCFLSTVIQPVRPSGPHRV